MYHPLVTQVNDIIQEITKTIAVNTSTTTTVNANRYRVMLQMCCAMTND